MVSREYILRVSANGELLSNSVCCNNSKVMKTFVLESIDKTTIFNSNLIGPKSFPKKSADFSQWVSSDLSRYQLK